MCCGMLIKAHLSSYHICYCIVRCFGHFQQCYGDTNTPLSVVFFATERVPAFTPSLGSPSRTAEVQHTSVHFWIYQHCMTIIGGHYVQLGCMVPRPLRCFQSTQWSTACTGLHHKQSTYHVFFRHVAPFQA